MSRKMIDANKKLFATLGAEVSDLVHENVRQQKRAIQTNVDEKRWLKEFSFRSPPHLALGPQSRFILGDYMNELYLITIGVDIPSPPDDLKPIQLNSGIFTAIVSDLSIPLIKNPELPQLLCEYIFYPVEEGETELLTMSVVSPFFESFSVFKVDPESALALDAEHGLRAALVATLCSPRSVPLDWPQSSLDRLGYMARDPAERAPFHLLLRALTETRGDAAFMAVYRCIEQLFPIPAIKELSTELGISSTPLQVAAKIESHLGWRRREDEALTHLFSKLSNELIERMRSVSRMDNSAENQSKPVAKRVYELRNQCVHYRPLHRDENSCQFSAWIELCDPLLEAVQRLYSVYTDAFNPPFAASPVSLMAK
jgi:hypothetical protein